MDGNDPGLKALRTELLHRGIHLGGRIGAGGAATVYEGHDKKHGRQVAIKVLDPIVAAAVTGERSAREIALASEARAGTVITGSFFDTRNHLEVSAGVTDARPGELGMPAARSWGHRPRGTSWSRPSDDRSSGRSNR